MKQKTARLVATNYGLTVLTVHSQVLWEPTWIKFQINNFKNEKVKNVETKDNN